MNAGDGKGDTALIYAAMNGHCSTLQQLLQSGANVNQFNMNRQTTLMLTALKGRKECVIRLIAAGADVNLVDGTNGNAFHYAAQEGEYDCLRELLTVSDVNHTDSTGRTTLVLV